MPAGEFPAGYNEFASIFMTGLSGARQCFKNEPVIVGVFNLSVRTRSMRKWLIEQMLNFVHLSRGLSIEFKNCLQESIEQRLKSSLIELFLSHAARNGTKRLFSRFPQASKSPWQSPKRNEAFRQVPYGAASHNRMIFERQLHFRRLHKLIEDDFAWGRCHQRALGTGEEDKSECRTQYKVTTDAARGHWPKEKLRKRREVRREVKDRRVVKCFRRRLCSFLRILPILIKSAGYASPETLRITGPTIDFASEDVGQTSDRTILPLPPHLAAMKFTKSRSIQFPNDSAT